jgi:hypothetical protein
MFTRALLILALAAGCVTQPQLVGTGPDSVIPLKPPPAPTPPTLTREKFMALYGSAEWQTFVAREKTEEELLVLQPWALEVEPVGPAALEALQHHPDPRLVPFWDEELKQSSRGSPQRIRAVTGLVLASEPGETAAFAEFFGDSDGVDLALIDLALRRRLSAPLRQYLERRKASPNAQHALTRALMILASPDAGGEVELQRARQEVGISQLPQLLELVGRGSESVQREAADLITFTLLAGLQRGDPGAATLAESWAERAGELPPSVSVVLARWLQSRGQVTRAKRVFERALSSPPAAPLAGSVSYAMNTPQVGYAVLMKQYGCLLESTGDRRGAIDQLHAFEELWAVLAEVRSLSTLLGSSSWCQQLSANTLAQVPVVMSAKRSGAKINVELRNVSASAVTVENPIVVSVAGVEKLRVPVSGPLAAGGKWSSSFPSSGSGLMHLATELSEGTQLVFVFEQ